MKTYFLFVFLIGNALAFIKTKSYTGSYTGPLDLFLKKVGFGLYKLDRKICDAQDYIEEIKEVLSAHEEQLAALETGQDEQNGRLNTLEANDMVLMTDISNLEVKDMNLMTDISDLQVKDMNLMTDISDLQVKDMSLMTDISDLQGSDEEQDVRLEMLEAKDMVLMTDISNLEDKNMNLMTDISDLQVKDMSLMTDISDLQDQLDELIMDLESFVEPVQCWEGNYNVLNDPLRSVDSPKDGSDIICDTTDENVQGYGTNTNKNDHGWMGNAWYRFEGDAGTIMPDSPTLHNFCGTVASGWLATTHPDIVFETIPATYCFRFNNAQKCKWYTEGLVTNCGDFFVYYLVNVATEFPKINKCNLGYCVTNV